MGLLVLGLQYIEHAVDGDDGARSLALLALQIGHEVAVGGATSGSRGGLAPTASRVRRACGGRAPAAAPKGARAHIEGDVEGHVKC